ncbi:DUF3299 domain-containing protein [Chitinibacter bivalviorum]|uniref:DUF3299 domain-containing protein n=1 Tax=Chitinibacter bivalviorum TaxID=2739434 RepID=A0A7H9BM98_9NEIS|nr:DUF3299 domain-containing protein [Chitinibacter bivalviorum]QLG89599.1 DUF3299 domain-containing protein [Chitinibacter bivalviorum]
MFAKIMLAISASCLAFNLWAAEAKAVKWSELQPDSPTLRATVGKMNQQEKTRLMRAVQQRELKNLVDSGKLKPSEFTANDVKLIKEDFKDLNPLINEIEAFEKKRTSEMSTALNGQTIQLDGYLLPLKQNGKKVTEFLLVPVIGACIHVPAPPPNQMVVVQYPKGYDQGDLFAPVTITGKLNIKASKANLALADGASDVPVGYAMSADEVRAYKAAAK